MDSCLVLEECFSRRILYNWNIVACDVNTNKLKTLRFRTSTIDLIHSERVSTSTSYFFAQRLAYPSYASVIIISGAMNMIQVTCVLDPCSKDLSVLYYVLNWDHLSLYGHMEHTEIVNQTSCKVQDPGKDPGSRVAANWLCFFKILEAT